MIIKNKKVNKKYTNNFKNNLKIRFGSLTMIKFKKIKDIKDKKLQH
jgi:hypothetical protein